MKDLNRSSSGSSCSEEMVYAAFCSCQTGTGFMFYTCDQASKRLSRRFMFTREWGHALASFRSKCAASATAACLGKLGMHRKISRIYFD